MPETLSELRELARSYGVQVEYADMDGQTRPASAESLLAVLRALGADLAGEGTPPGAGRSPAGDLAAAGRAGGRRLGRRPGRVEVRLPASLASRARCRLATEPGEPREWTATGRPAEVDRAAVDGERFVAVRLPAAGAAAHRLSPAPDRFEDGQTAESLVIAAPTRAYQGPGGTGKRPGASSARSTPSTARGAGGRATSPTSKP